MAMARAAEFSPVSCTILGETDPSVSVEGGLTSHTLGGWVVVSGEEVAVVVVGGVVVAVVVVVPDGVGVNVGGDSAENSGDWPPEEGSGAEPRVPLVSTNEPSGGSPPSLVNANHRNPIIRIAITATTRLVQRFPECVSLCIDRFCAAMRRIKGCQRGEYRLRNLRTAKARLIKNGMAVTRPCPNRLVNWWGHSARILEGPRRRWCSTGAFKA